MNNRNGREGKKRENIHLEEGQLSSSTFIIRPGVYRTPVSKEHAYSIVPPKPLYEPLIFWQGHQASKMKTFGLSSSGKWKEIVANNMNECFFVFPQILTTRNRARTKIQANQTLCQLVRCKQASRGSFPGHKQM